MNMKIKKSLACALVALATLPAAYLSHAAASGYLPSVLVGTAGGLTSPTVADSYYCTTVPTGCTASGTVDLWSGGYPTEIQTLAHALHNNVDLIYEYVRNYIEFEPMYGLQKGALGAIIDQSGTAFDQAQLMVDLLRASGYTAGYVQGTITLTGAQVQSWLNVTDAGSLINILADGGIPATVTPSSGTVTSATIAHIWVSVVISGTTYYFDPAFKPHNFTTPLLPALGTTMGWSDSTFTSHAFSGATTGYDTATPDSGSGTVSVPYVSGLNTTQMQGQLALYSANLLSTIQGMNPVPQLDDLLGRHDIQAKAAGNLRQTSLPYGTAIHTWGPASNITDGNIPDAYRTKFTAEMIEADLNTIPINYLGTLIPARTFFTDEVYGRRILYDISNTQWQPGIYTLKVDDTPVTVQGGSTVLTYTDSTTPGERWYGVRLQIDHPYAALGGTYMDQTVANGNSVIRNAVVFDAPVNLVLGLGDVSANLLTKFNAEKPHDSYFPISNYNCAGSETCGNTPQALDSDMTEAKAAAGWLSQYSQMARMQAQIASSVHQMHHAIGIAATNPFLYSYWKADGTGTYTCQGNNNCWSILDSAQVLDVDTGISVNSRIGNASDRAALVQAIPAAADALEGSVYEQQVDATSPAAVSTRFEYGNDGEQVKFYLLSGATTSRQLFPQGPAYPGGQAPSAPGVPYTPAYPWMKAYVNNGYTVIGAADAELGPGNLCGTPDPIIKGPNGWIFLPICPSSLTRGGAFFAWGTPGAGQSPGNYQSIAHIVTNAYGTAYKGGGAGAPPSYEQEYVPSESADALKDKFQDRSKLLGVDLKSGDFNYSAGTDLSVGNGGFPYELSFWRSFKSGAAYSPGMGPGWSHNLDIRASMGSSGMEAMGTNLAANATASLVTFYVTQQLLRPQSPALTGIPLLERTVLAPLVLRWWTNGILHNTVTINRGASAEQWVRLPNGVFNPPKGAKGTLTQTGSPAIMTNSAGETNQWNYGSVSFTYTSTQGDVQQFAIWVHKNHDIRSTTTYGTQHGWHLSSWTFPYGVTLNFTYQAPGSETTDWYNDNLMTVSNNLGRSLTFDVSRCGSGWLDECLGGVSDGQGRSVTFAPFAPNTDPFGDGYALLGSVTLPNGSNEVEQYTYQIGKAGTSSTRPLSYPRLTAAYAPSDTSHPKLVLGYDGVNSVLTYQDATTILYPSQRAAYQFFITDGTRGERLDPLGNSYATYYDSYGRDIQYIDELGRITTATYDGKDRALSRIFPEGDKELFGYDGNNNVTSLNKVPIATGASSLSWLTTAAPSPASLTISASYTVCDKINSLIDARNNTTTWTYNPTTCTLTKVTQPQVTDATTGSAANPVTQYGYNGYGQINSLTDPSGLAVSYTYDANNYRHTRVVDPSHLALTTTYGYDAYGDINSVTNPDTHTTTYGYDFDRRVTYQSAGSGSTCSYTKFVRDPDGDITSISRDKDQSCTQQTWATKTTTYTPTKKPLVVTDEMGFAGVSLYDGLDRATDSTICLTVGAPGTSNPLAPTCPGGSRTTHTVFDAAGQTSFTYKGWGSADQITYASYTYGPDGEVTTVKDANSNTTSSVFDGYLRLYRSCLPDSTGACNGSPTDYEQYAYDNNGNQTAKQNRDGRSLSFAFDALNRETSHSVPANAQGHFQRTLTTSYDLAGRKWDVGLTDTETGTSTSQTLRDRYDTAKRLQSVDDTLLQGLFNAGCTTGSTTLASRCFGSVAYGYDAAGNRTGLTLYGAGGTTSYAETYGYDALERFTTLSDSLATHASYSPYDALGRPTSATWGNSSHTSWGFQDNDDLISLGHTVGSLSTNWGLTHDGSHQITGESLSDNTLEMKTASAAVSYAHNSLNQYTTVNGTSQAYDPDGNLTGDGTWTYEYDEENRLRKATGPHAVLYDYDPAGRRRSKSVDGTLTYYSSDGAEEVAEWGGSGSLTTRYLNGIATDDHIAMLDYSSACASAPTTPCRYYYHPDWHGSTVLLSTASNTIGNSYRYGPYGEDLTDGSTGNPFRYTGRKFDAETGLYYYRARYYSPTLGRFLQTDPIGSKDDLDLYAYVGDDPLNKTDPTGNCPWCIAAWIFLTENSATIGAVTVAGAEIATGTQTPVSGPASAAGQEVKVIATEVKAAGAEVKAVESAAGSEAKTYTTYTREKPDGTVYSGRTSGTSSAEGQVAARTSKADHQAKTAEGYGPAKVDKNSANKDAIRGREQQLIDQNGGARSTGGTSGNAINGVSSTNQNAAKYQQACTNEFGCSK